MKLRHSWRGKSLVTVSEAVETQTSPDPWSHSGELESLRERVDSLATLTGKLIEILADKNSLTIDDILMLLPSFESPDNKEPE